MKTKGMDTGKPIRKVYELKGAELAENRLRGASSVMGSMDRGDDCIFPGSYKKCLKQFLKDGFVPVGHDWWSLPVAYPVSAKEEGKALLCDAVFHSTQDAQDARTVCMERLAAGLSVGLSVGFMPDYADGVHWFENGAEMLAFAEDGGYDMSLFDARGIRACKDYCRGITAIKELYEFSIVPVPMMPLAQATDVKGSDPLSITTEREFEAFLRDAGLAAKTRKTVISQVKTLYLSRDAEIEAAEDAVPEATCDEMPDDPEPLAEEPKPALGGADPSRIVALRMRHGALREWQLRQAGGNL